MASRRAYLGAQYLPALPAGTRTTSPACASTVTPPDSTNSCPSITKLYSLCGCSSLHDSAVSSHSNSAGSDQPPGTGGMIARHFGLSCPLESTREYLVGAFAGSAITLFPCRRLGARSICARGDSWPSLPIRLSAHANR